MNLLWVVIGAGIGGGLRYLVGAWMGRWSESFPWYTFAINVFGAFLLGVLMAFSAEREVPVAARLFLGVGVLGGFTTFSTLSYESVALMERGLMVQGAANMFGSALAGMAAVVLGLLVGRAI